MSPPSKLRGGRWRWIQIPPEPKLSWRSSVWSATIGQRWRLTIAGRPLSIPTTAGSKLNIHGFWPPWAINVRRCRR